jgi:hypothetical protein
VFSIWTRFFDAPTPEVFGVRYLPSSAPPWTVTDTVFSDERGEPEWFGDVTPYVFSDAELHVWHPAAEYARFRHAEGVDRSNRRDGIRATKAAIHGKCVAASRWLVCRFGDGSTSSSFDTWMTFLSLASVAPDTRSFGELVEATSALHAEQTLSV